MTGRTPARAARAALGALATVATLAAAGCARGSRPDVVIVTLDTLRADRLGCYGHRGGLTPNLDRLAGQGVLFEDASTAIPITLPSHATLFTGRYPTATGVRNNGAFQLPAGETTLAELLRRAGWRTGAVIASHPLHARYGLDQGFELYDDDLPEPEAVAEGQIPIFFAERDARTVTDLALGVWGRLAPGPRLLWVHYFDPHAPYAAPEPHAGAHPGQPYDAEVAFLDAELGRLLARIEKDAPGALVVVAADHGEGLGEHGEKTHGVFLYQGTMRVPLLVRGPGVPASRRVAEPVSLADVVPTVLSLLGLELPAGVEGTDLRRLLEQDGRRPGTIYGESYLARLQFRFHELTMLRRGSLKYVAAPTPELYDLATDPTETRNLHGAHPDEADLAAALADWTQAADPGASDAAVGALDAETEQKLRSLGYAAAGTLHRQTGESARDPKGMTDYLTRYDRAIGLIAQGRAAEGIEQLRTLVPEAPENYMARYQISAGLLSSGRHDEAEAELLAVVQAAPEFSNGYLMLADVQARQGRYDEALRSYAAASQTAPTLAAPHLARAMLLESIGRFDEAAAAYGEAVAVEPRSGEAPRRLLQLWSGRGRADRAARELGELAGRHPRSAPLQVALAGALRRIDRPADAKAALDRALALDPGDADALVELGSLALAGGRHGEAEAAFRRAIESDPGRIEAHFGRARALLAAGRTLEADAAFADVLRLDPRFSPAHTARGVHFERSGRTAEAIAAYRKAIEINPRDRVARQGLQRLAGGADGGARRGGAPG